MAGNALRKARKVLDPLGGADAAADADLVDHHDLEPVARRHHGGRQAGNAGAHDHNIEVLHGSPQRQTIYNAIGVAVSTCRCGIRERQNAAYLPSPKAGMTRCGLTLSISARLSDTRGCTFQRWNSARPESTRRRPLVPAATYPVNRMIGSSLPSQRLIRVPA